MMRPAQGISWFIEMRGATLGSQGGGIRLSIPYPQAALWAIIANGNYRQDLAVELMMALLCTDKAAAQREVEKSLDVWLQLGIVAKA